MVLFRNEYGSLGFLLGLSLVPRLTEPDSCSVSRPYVGRCRERSASSLRSRPLGAPSRVLKAPRGEEDAPSRSLGGGRDRGGSDERLRVRSLRWRSPRSVCTWV